MNVVNCYINKLENENKQLREKYEILKWSCKQEDEFIDSIKETLEDTKDFIYDLTDSILNNIEENEVYNVELLDTLGFELAIVSKDTGKVMFND